MEFELINRVCHVLRVIVNRSNFKKPNPRRIIYYHSFFTYIGISHRLQDYCPFYIGNERLDANVPAPDRFDNND